MEIGRVKKILHKVMLRGNELARKGEQAGSAQWMKGRGRVGVGIGKRGVGQPGGICKLAWLEGCLYSTWN